jgi:hypothetical protein
MNKTAGAFVADEGETGDNCCAREGESAASKAQHVSNVCKQGSRTNLDLFMRKSLGTLDE